MMKHTHIFFMMMLLLAVAVSANAQSWNITGNSATSPATNFIGTTDKQAFVFKTNNKEQMRILAAGRIGIGIKNPLQKLQVNGNIDIDSGFALYMENHRVLSIDSVHGNIFLGNGVAINSTGNYNTVSGFQAFHSNTTGSQNTANGYSALYSNTTGNYNLANGVDALFFNTEGGGNVANGSNALEFNTSGNFNTATGYQSLYVNGTGSYNTADGSWALYANYTGSGNTANGSGALYENSTGSYNTAGGYGALYFNTAGSYNTANGSLALENNSGNFNTGIGSSALVSNTTGEQNTAVGPDALWDNTTGAQNTAIGYNALTNNIDSWANTAVGNAAGAAYHNGWNNTFVGSGADATSDDIYNSTALGNNVLVSAPDQVRIGNNFVTSIGGFANWTNISDGRVKKNIKENVPGLAFINKLKPVTYNLDLDAVDKIMPRPAIKDKDGKQLTQKTSQAEINARSAKQQIVYTGFVAQDVEKAAKDLNYDFSGVDAAKNDKDLYGLRYAEFVVPLVKAVQELSKQNDSLQKQNDALQKQNDTFEKRIEKLEAMMNVQSTTANDQPQITTVSSASIDQNIPNPFSNATIIHYTLPQQYTVAKIIIADKSGSVLKEMKISGAGKGSVEIDASTLAQGSYQYSLIANGRLIGTKQMILTK
jgi:hypothetical protein